MQHLFLCSTIKVIGCTFCTVFSVYFQGFCVFGVLLPPLRGQYTGTVPSQEAARPRTYKVCHVLGKSRFRNRVSCIAVRCATIEPPLLLCTLKTSFTNLQSAEYPLFILLCVPHKPNQVIIQSPQYLIPPRSSRRIFMNKPIKPSLATRASFCQYIVIVPNLNKCTVRLFYFYIVESFPV